MECAKDQQCGSSRFFGFRDNKNQNKVRSEGLGISHASDVIIPNHPAETNLPCFNLFGKAIYFQTLPAANAQMPSKSSAGAGLQRAKA